MLMHEIYVIEKQRTYTNKITHNHNDIIFDLGNPYGKKPRAQPNDDIIDMKYEEGYRKRRNVIEKGESASKPITENIYIQVIITQRTSYSCKKETKKIRVNPNGLWVF